MAIDWRQSDTRSPIRRIPAPALDVLTYWQLANPAGQTLTCELHRTTSGLFVLCGLDGEDPFRSQMASSLAAAYCIASAWKTSALEQGFTHARDAATARLSSSH
jgi:hypothetical protein